MMLSSNILAKWHLLIVDQICIGASEGQKFLMRTALHDKTLIKDQNQIGVANGAQPVGYHNDGLLARQLSNGTHDSLLRYIVKSTSCLIKNNE